MAKPVRPIDYVVGEPVMLAVSKVRGAQRLLEFLEPARAHSWRLGAPSRRWPAGDDRRVSWSGFADPDESS